MKVKLLDKECTPYKKHNTDACWDLVAAESCTIHKSGTIARPVKTGIAVAIPEGYMGLILPRSSSVKSGLAMANTVGVIDSDYRGEILVYLRSTLGRNVTINKGDRFAQLAIVPVYQQTLEFVDDLNKTTRGEGGFGSTGTKAPKKLTVKEKIELAKESK